MSAARSFMVKLCLLAAVLGIPGAASAQGTMLWGVVRNQNTLVLFNSANPSALLFSTPISGLAPGDLMRGIEFRPANGLLYGVATQAGVNGQARLYLINPLTGQASAVGPAVTVAPPASFCGMSFDPVADRVRLVNSTGANVRLHPDTGALVANDTPLATQFIAPDAIAYDNQVAGATQTTLYAIRIGDQMLVRIGGPQGTPSPNLGEMTDIGPLGLPLSFAGQALDWAPDGTLFAALAATPTQSALYTIDATTGAATQIGVIGNGAVVLDSLAVGHAGLSITPDGGTFTSRQRFDLVMLLNAPGRSVVNGNAIFDGLDVTGHVVSCARFGRTIGGLTTIRCANVGGPIFGPGNHTFTVNLTLDSGEVVSSTASWFVLAASEP